jgi:hypothetical protein
MYIKKNFFFIFIAGVAIFFWSYILLSYYTEGDQVSYLKFYEFQKDLTIYSIFSKDKFILDTSEPLYKLLVWIGSNLGIDKKIYTSAFNLILSLGLILFLKKEKAPLHSYFFILFNYYLIMLFAPAERLKYAYVFLIYSTLVSYKLKYFFILLAVLCHAQIIILIIGYLLYFFLKFTQNKSLKLKFLSILYYMILLLFIYLFKGNIKIFLEFAYHKFTSYKADYFFVDYYKILILSFSFLLVTKKPIKLFIIYFPMIAISYIIGDQRINILIFSIGMYYIIIEKQLNHPIIIILMIYYFIKNTIFLYNIFKYNDGYLGIIF